MSSDNKKRCIELLAPARDANVALQAIKCGADAVYMGAENFGARASAGNSVEDIAQVVEFAHKYGARVYVTINTIIFDNELDAVEQLIWRLYEVGVDALIVQDMSLLRMKLPPIELHASTQCDIRDVAKARFLQEIGFSQIVVARELSLKEINEIYKGIDVPIEAFVHGALCVSYSGDCQASCIAMGRSANRGECAQMCRLPYTLYDGAGNVLIADKHLLSLRDMNRSDYIKEMLEAGVSSFKIEGRLKDVGYVKNIVAYYRNKIDEVISQNPERYCRASYGKSLLNFEPLPEKSFNRGFTSYFLNGKHSSIASIDTPKSIGARVAVVKHCRGNELVVALEETLANGDGLGYFNSKGEFCGFRLNRISGNKLYPASKVDLKVGTILYRNSDKAWIDKMHDEVGVSRVIELKMHLQQHDGKLILTVEDERGCKVNVVFDASHDIAQTPQEEARKRVLKKLGNTIYTVASIKDDWGNVFIPASKLTDLRRKAIDALDEQWKNVDRRNHRRMENANCMLPQGNKLSYHDNVANRLAEEFYRQHGATTIERAVEVDQKAAGREIVVMTTRYCLRREMGYCLKTSQGARWKSPLHITSANHRFRLDFDCSKCEMKVVHVCD